MFYSNFYSVPSGKQNLRFFDVIFDLNSRRDFKSVQ